MTSRACVLRRCPMDKLLRNLQAVTVKQKSPIWKSLRSTLTEVFAVGVCCWFQQASAESNPPIEAVSKQNFSILPFRKKELDWRNVGGDKGNTRYSSLKQIHRNNVKQLQVAWTYRTGDASKGSTIQCTPLMIGGTLYLTTVRSKVVALDASTGSERWKFDPYEGI